MRITFPEQYFNIIYTSNSELSGIRIYLVSGISWVFTCLITELRYEARVDGVRSTECCSRIDELLFQNDICYSLISKSHPVLSVEIRGFFAVRSLSQPTENAWMTIGV